MKYDVALSFAGEDRKYVEAVANELKRLGIDVFYDDFETVNLWGKNLYGHLQNVYRNEARYTVLFLSEHYAKKAWTSHELEAAQARAFNENEEYILPARFDRTEIDGVLPTVGYIDLNKYTPQEFAHLVVQKVKGEKIAPQTTKQPAHHPQKYKNLILFTPRSAGNQGTFLKFSNIERAETINLSVTADGAQESAFLDGLRAAKNSNLFITYNLNCLSTRINSVAESIDNGNEIWKVNLTPEKSERSHEFAFQGLTLDQIAEIRAKKILLNEPLPVSNSFIQNMFTTGIANNVKLEPYIPSTSYKQASQKDSFDRDLFLAEVKLLLVRSLILSNTVEYIFTLDLRFVSDDEMSVKFEGRRARIYSNIEPAVIEVEGVVDLADE